MTRVLALADQSKIGCITQRRFAKVGAKTHPQRGAALDRNGLSVSTETACRFEPKSPVGNSEICNYAIGPRLNSAADGTIASSGLMAPRLSTISKRPFFAWAMYMFMRTWCWPGTISAGPPGPSAILA